ncbi:hypothetical protein KC326_g104 [Hortaea werneckii]|nr:hypothetical protein KC326_g104 [Hortaea werneckii]
MIPVLDLRGRDCLNSVVSPVFDTALCTAAKIRTTAANVVCVTIAVQIMLRLGRRSLYGFPQQLGALLTNDPLATAALHPLPCILADVCITFWAFEPAVQLSLLQLRPHPRKRIKEVMSARCRPILLSSMFNEIL